VVLAAALPAAALPPAATGAASPAARDEVLVRVAPGATAGQVARVREALGAERATALPGGWRLYELPAPVTAAEARADLTRADADRAVLLNGTVRATAPPDDPLFAAHQWALSNTGQTIAGSAGLAGADIGALAGWGAAGPLAPVVVAVVDTGADLAHPDLAGAAWDNPALPGTHGWDLIDDDATPAAETHGTHVAGTIAATAGDGVGVAGVAPNARIMSVRFLDQSDGGRGTWSDAMLALDWARDHGATVVNASWGAAGLVPPVCDAIADVVASGVTVVAAAGNDGLDTGQTPSTPASCGSPGLVVVGATDNRDRLADFSNRGAADVDLAAPGVDVAAPVPGAAWGYLSGTSMAAPHVTGVAAILEGLHPEMAPRHIRAAVTAGGEAVAGLAGTSVSGRRLDLPGTLALLGPPAAPLPGAPAGDATVPAGAVAFTWTADGGTDVALVVDGVDRAAGPGSGAAVVTLAAGAHTWSVRATSPHGVAAASPTRALTVTASPSPPGPAPPSAATDPPPAPVAPPGTPAPAPAPGPGAVGAPAGPAVTRLAVLGTPRAGRPVRLVLTVARGGTLSLRMRTPAGRVVLAARVSLAAGVRRLTLFPSAAVRPGRYRLTAGGRTVAVRVRVR
jgi:subtilisin family serine protease